MTTTPPKHFVVEVVTAVLWRVEELVEKGADFDTAKRKAITQAESTWRGFPPGWAEVIRHHASDLRFTDMSDKTRAIVRERVYAELGKARGRPLTWWDRTMFALTGRVSGH